MPDDDPLGSSVTYADPTEGWTAEPVDGDPFAVPDSSSVPDSSVTRNRPVLAGHVAAAPTADQNYTPKYLAARPQGSISSYDPSLSERLQQGVSEAGQALGQPVEGAERMGGFARQAAEMAPISGNILQGNEAMRSYNAGDPWGTLLHGAMALPIPGAPQEGAVARKISPLGFYSHGADVAANLSQQRGTTQQLVAALQKGGVKPAELKAAGLDDLSDMPPTTSREELADMFHRTQPPLQETQLGDDKYEVSKDGQRWANPPKFGEYTLPGGQNYREVLMHLPTDADAMRAEAERRGYGDRIADWPDQEFANQYRQTVTNAPTQGFNSSHWDTPNVVAHLRLNDRTGQDGENLLHMEELQSDWGQGGRDKGFQDPEKLNAFKTYMDDAKNWMATGIRQDGLDDGLSEDAATRIANRFVAKAEPHDVSNYLNEHDRMTGAYATTQAEQKKLPSAPYVTNTQQWTDLGLKRALIEAANGDYTHLSWTPGEDQAKRYDLTKHISDLSYSPHSGSLQARAVGGGRAMDERGVAPEDLHTYVGQEVAAKLLAQPQGPHFSLPDLHSDPNYAPQWAQGGWRTLSGQDLKVGGEGMKGYYDNMVPKSLMKIAKKLDPNAKLGTSTIKGLDVANPNRFERGREVPSMEITPLMRERIKQGLPQYQRGGRVGFADGGDVDTSMLEPVDHDPFPPEPQVQDSDIARAKGFPEPRSPMHARLAALGENPAPSQQGFTGHVAAEQVPGQNLTPKYLAAHPQGSLSPGDPSLAERLQQGVSETAQRAGVPVQGAERMGETVRTGAEYAPVSSNILSAADAYQAGQRGDVLGAITGAIGAVPIPGAGSAERAGVGAIERGADGILRHADPAFQEGRIATTTPWSKKLGDPHQSGEATIGHDTMQASGETYDKTAGIIKEMPYTGVKTKTPAQNGQKAKTTTTWTPTGDLNIDPNATPEEAHEAFIEHAKSNILALHDAVPDDIRQGSMQWYDGANTIAKQRAQQYDKPLENIAGTYAALSPQMDWYKNASLGDRVMDISTRQGNSPFSPEMQNWVNGYLTNSSSADTAKSAAIFDKIKDTPLGQITDPLERAHWIRAYDEAHNDRAYNLVNPDGTFGDTVKKGDGTNAGAGWGSMDAIANAVTAFGAKDMPTVSEAMGGGHKVRNFYNNILNPNAPTGDVTVDTHAIAAALLRPLSGSDKDTAIGLGTAPPTNAMTGSKGLYGAYAEAYRRAAAERGILPRQMQSITWEAIRGLYSPVEKRTPSFRQAVNDAWARHGSGEWTQQEVQRHLMTNPETGASRIRPPSWHTGSAIEEPED